MFQFSKAFNAQDLYPRIAGRPQWTPVETPELRARHCADPSRGDKTAIEAGVLCEPLELPSWDEAEEKAASTLAQMTDDERYSLMVGTGWAGVPFFVLPAVPTKGHYMGNVAPISRLGVPPLKLHDAGNGYRNNPWPSGTSGTSTLWPSSLSFGATWDTELINRVAAAIGREYRGKGANVILGPAIQVHRVARNGRNFEYMSGEDPYLGAKLTAAYVRGVQSEGIMATMKHYAFNEQETNRSGGNVVVDDRTAWELYYPPFEAGVRAGAGAVMCSYNRVNGSYSCANEELLARDLKKKMGFRGFVMSDWWALQDDTEKSVPRGFDQEMPGAGFGTHLSFKSIKAMEEQRGGQHKGLLGLSGDKLYRDPAFRVLAATYKLRIPERPSCSLGTDCVPHIDSDQRNKEHSALSRDVTIKSAVLLKNSGILPLKGSTYKKLGLIGLPLDAKSSGEGGMGGDYYSGGGSGHCVIAEADLVTPFQALKRRAEREGMEVVHQLSNDLGPAMGVASQADVVIVLAATTAGESEDRPSLDLDFGADSLILAVARIRPTIVLVQAPGTVFMPWHNEVPAIAILFLGGEFTSAAWEAVVFGDVSPSGKLPLMIPKDRAGVVEPTMYTDVDYTREGIFTSYRARNADTQAVFPFGHGLAYANFTYGEAELLSDKECPEPAVACVRVVITNSGDGDVPAAEVAQAYVAFAPELNYPKVMLKGFYKTQALKRGDKEAATFQFTARDFSIYDHGEWRLQRKVTVHVGASSADLRVQLPVSV